MEALSDAWVSALVDASSVADGDIRGSGSGVVEFAIGKKNKATVVLSDGHFAQVKDDNVDVDLTLPFANAEELTAYLSGELSMAKAYIRGDFKPVGSTGLLIPVIELVESGALSAVVAE